MCCRLRPRNGGRSGGFRGAGLRCPVPPQPSSPVRVCVLQLWAAKHEAYLIPTTQRIVMDVLGVPDTRWVYVVHTQPHGALHLGSKK